MKRKKKWFRISFENGEVVEFSAKTLQEAEAKIGTEKLYGSKAMKCEIEEVEKEA